MMNRDKICPECGSVCWRDEHPDGIAVGLWGCFNCDWFEKPNTNEGETIL